METSENFRRILIVSSMQGLAVLYCVFQVFGAKNVFMNVIIYVCLGERSIKNRLANGFKSMLLDITHFSLSSKLLAENEVFRIL